MWSSDRGLILLSLFLIIEIFLLQPLANGHLALRFVLWIVSSLIIITGTTVISPSKVYRSATVILAVTVLALHWLYFARHDAAIASLLSVLVFHSALAFMILLRVFREGAVTPARIYGGIAVYLLIGMIWANLYSIIELLHSGSFQLVESFSSPQDLKLNMIYFSFTTLTTLGYGDITPLSPYARSFANLEALIGQLYPAILLARLVSLQGTHHHPKKGGEYGI